MIIRVRYCNHLWREENNIIACFRQIRITIGIGSASSFSIGINSMIIICGDNAVA